MTRLGPRWSWEKSWWLFAGLLCLLSGPTQAQTSQPAAKQEKSVKPGINDQWKSPEVGPLVDWLEAESREIYRERAKLADLVGLQPGMAVADVGAGSGFMVEEFARRVGPAGKVYAVDINPKLLELIAGRARRQSMAQVQTVLTREDSLDLPANSVDLVFLCDTYHHFEYPQESLRGIFQALRAGGEMVVVEFRREPGSSEAWLLEHVRAGKEEFIKEFQAAGFELVAEPAAAFLKQNYVLHFRKPAKPN